MDATKHRVRVAREKVSQPPVTLWSWSPGRTPADSASGAQVEYRQRPALQPKLTVSHPGDPAEREAEAVADRVMRAEAPSYLAEIGRVGGPALGRKGAECTEEEASVARDAESSGRVEGEVSPVVSEALQSAGQPLDAGTRAFMEPRFGHDFSQVRVHTDARADESARGVSALAYTLGRDIVFRSGQYAPETQAGRRLLAHELTHVVQQGGAGVVRRLQRQEDEADGEAGLFGEELFLPELSVQDESEGPAVNAKTVHLKGETKPHYGRSANLVNQKVTAAKGCAGCKPPECVRVTGTLVMDFKVTTTVTLPRLSDFPNLTACEKGKVKHAIDNILAPHEQDHVRAFETYNGRVTQPFDATLCKSEVLGRIQQMLDAVNGPRQAAAQAASDALDPFNFDFDIDCDEKKAESEPEASEPEDSWLADLRSLWSETEEEEESWWA